MTVRQKFLLSAVVVRRILLEYAPHLKREQADMIAAFGMECAEIVKKERI